MNQKEIKELIEFLVEKDIAEFELERGDVKVRVKRGAEAHVAGATMAAVAPQAAPSDAHTAQASAAPLPAPAAPAAPKAAVEAVEEAELHIVRSPIVGSYYGSPSPGTPAFVNLGDQVQVGQVLCIVEAMKLMNEIESDAAGEIVKILVANSQPVEYGQPLFAIKVK
jgi:acetyl-CoA carboxylase biotin carboxyl carrier protein